MSADVFKQAKWIWNSKAVGTDCYCEFVSDINIYNAGQSRIRISSDSNYALYINGRFVESGQYADYPDYKVYDGFDITGYIVSGLNRIHIIVWYYGVKTFNYVIGNPGLIFEIEQNGKTILSSNSEVLSRKSCKYLSGKNEMITPQLGLNFHVDLTQESVDGFEKSVICEKKPKEFIARPVKKLNIGDIKNGVLVSQGAFSYKNRTGNCGEKMQNAALEFYRFENMTGQCSEELVLQDSDADGIYIIVDLLSETTGYIDFCIDVPKTCEMEIGWGEHLLDGRCRTKIGRRNFSATVKLRAGDNSYMNPFRRFGCRYLQFFIHSNRVKIGHLGLRPVTYPLNIKSYKSGNLLRDTVYKVCQNTLIQCMHEHYEDCTWREQSFYTLDSRNQMLCGYYAFGEYEFPKACLKLFSKAVTEDGLLTICCPTDEELRIISFTLFYIIQLAEYYEYSNDLETVRFCFDTAKRIVDNFVSRIGDTGLVANFEGKNYWNFYEWQPFLDGSDNNSADRYDTCLNALLSLVLQKFSGLCNAVGVDDTLYLSAKTRLNIEIKNRLFDKDIGLFRLYYGQKDNVISVLANALGYLSGAITENEAGRVLELIENNSLITDDFNVIETTLSMDTFRYEALLKSDKDRYKDVILKEIDKVYLNMLRCGATSFWETKKGAADFHGAGSLCHGWSAMPIYYYETLFSKGE